MASLYLCYLSICDPLTQAQVVAYLEGLGQAGFRMVLLTFEPRPLTRRQTESWGRWLAARGIVWHWVRYHKRPTVLATAWDVVRGILVGLALARRYRVSLLHARSHVPGLMALALKRLTGARFLFDVRGFMAEEYVDAGTWPEGGLLFRATKKVERRLVRAADGIVVLTRKARDALQRSYPGETRGKRIEVIPCCVDRRGLPPPGGAGRHDGGNGREKTVVYVGKLGGWYLGGEMADFVARAVQEVPGLRWRVWTQTDPRAWASLLEARGLQDHVAVGRIAHDALPAELARSHAGLSFVRPCPSKVSSSPTKVGEYLAAGLPVISSQGIGDVDELLGQGAGAGGPVGVLVSDFTPRGYEEALRRLLALWQDPQTPARCRAAAAEHLDLEKVGWARYRQIYQYILAGPTEGQAWT